MRRGLVIEERQQDRGHAGQLTALAGTAPVVYCTKAKSAKAQ
jgi:hypothetical protein